MSTIEITRKIPEGLRDIPRRIDDFVQNLRNTHLQDHDFSLVWNSTKMRAKIHSEHVTGEVIINECDVSLKLSIPLSYILFKGTIKKELEKLIDEELSNC
jgi:hypothetical protein